MSTANDNKKMNPFSGILKDSVMYYQTTLRNVGLYTSISIALFTFSKFFADNYLFKDAGVIKVIVRILATLVLIVSMYISFHLYIDFSKLKNFENINDSNTIVISSWVNLLFFIFFIQIFLLIVYIFVSHQHFTNKKKFSLHN